MNIGAMILAAGRGERMRPLSDTTPKPLLVAGGAPLIVHQIRALSRAGFTTIAINVSHCADAMIEALGDGSKLGVTIRWSREREPFETAGGIATAMPLLPPGPALIVSGDIWTRYDYRRLVPIAERMHDDVDLPRVHLVMVPNPSYHPLGDFSLDQSASLVHRSQTTDRRGMFTYGNIGIYDTALFRELPRETKLQLLPLLNAWIDAGQVSGELYEGPWENVGTPADLVRLDAALGATPLL
ncbi:MAG TPA: nucleotidyltransferase family protein [Casimicrobiaceae bacterium]|nr:nucleotidyltransferase family protein [Casimicrobiaceae bacterium]